MNIILLYITLYYFILLYITLYYMPCFELLQIVQPKSICLTFHSIYVRSFIMLWCVIFLISWLWLVNSYTSPSKRGLQLNSFHLCSSLNKEPLELSTENAKLVIEEIKQELGARYDLLVSDNILLFSGTLFGYDGGFSSKLFILY
jgi:hypothetical protein